ncbi:hypothetical protein G647_01467 [Cladophialophora carrionii CBS 160.54]|uniref:F-box domain-containing protein n=1 Tax=Cladophialophora carrionii CBS 160.54 TaxID=1279043 RepID=V9DQ19_9EURO|nr:uncharacterized protein G647_01467 [Cladophialophora carrionii CBS 160.54]ETI29014.1 hypothetical protein G647_01467 [Cladophialophora carrionii CBS 160.54]
MPPRWKPQRTPTSWDPVPQHSLSLFRVPHKVGAARFAGTSRVKDRAEHLTQLDLTPAAMPTEDGEIDGAEKTAVTTRSSQLKPPHQPTASLAALPPEIVLEIASYLHPVDRICLALTCKSLLSCTLRTLRCTRADWVFFHDRGYSRCLHPQTPMLYERLAHGWVPKDRFRYCNHCYKILPRCPEYFKQRLRRQRKPKYDVRVACTGVSEKQWNSMSKKKRYAHLLHNWCHSEKKGDSIDYFCAYCREKMAREGRDCEMDCELPGSCSTAEEAVVQEGAGQVLQAPLAAPGVAGLLDAFLLRVGPQLCV